MPELIGFPPGARDKSRSVRVAGIAERQGGVVGARQLLGEGVSRSTVSRWVERGRLHPLHPGVYAVGHRAIEIRGRLFAALLYADPSGASLSTRDAAALSHQTAGWWWHLLEAEPTRIHLIAPGEHDSLPGVAVHGARRRQVVRHRGLPVTPVTRTLRDLAACLPFRQLRRVVAEADHRGLLEAERTLAQLGRGRPGSAALRKALEIHMPELALARSVLEERFLELVKEAGLPMPEVNVHVGRFLVDAVWHDARVIVELDGHASHATPAAAERDRARDLELRAAGYVVLRYTWRQITQASAAVIADVTAALRPN